MIFAIKLWEFFFIIKANKLSKKWCSSCGQSLLLLLIKSPEMIDDFRKLHLLTLQAIVCLFMASINVIVINCNVIVINKTG